MFKEVLETIIERTEGSLGALIMGIDGIARGTFPKTGGSRSKLDVAAADYFACTKRRRRLAKTQASEICVSFVISLEDAVLLVRLLGQEYFVVLAISPEGNLGRARFELRKAELQIASEFADVNTFTPH